MQHLTLLQLSEMSGVSKSYISQIENNTSNGWESIDKLLKALGLTVEDANAEGVNWWASDSPAPAAKTSDMQYIIDWLNAQPAELVKEFRLLLEHIEELRRENR